MLVVRTGSRPRRRLLLPLSYLSANARGHVPMGRHRQVLPVPSQPPPSTKNIVSPWLIILSSSSVVPKDSMHFKSGEDNLHFYSTNHKKMEYVLPCKVSCGMCQVRTSSSLHRPRPISKRPGSMLMLIRFDFSILFPLLYDFPLRPASLPPAPPRLAVPNHGRRPKHVSHLPRSDPWHARGRVETQRPVQG